MFIYRVWKHRKSLDDIQQQLGFLFTSYKKQVYCWEFIILIRKILILLFLALIDNGSFVFLVLLYLVLLFSLIIHIAMWQYECNHSNWMEAISLLTLLLNVFITSLIQAGKTPDSATATIVVGAHAIVLLLLVGFLLCEECCNTKQQQNNEPEQQPLRTEK